jgi:hypothetical protein
MRHVRSPRWIAPWVVIVTASAACHDAAAPAKNSALSPRATSAPLRAPATLPPSSRQMSPARVTELAAFVAKVREHPFKKPLPPVRFVPRAERPTIAGANGAVTQIHVQGRYFDDRHEITIAEELESSPDLDRIVVHELVHALMTDWGVTNFVVEGSVHGSLFGRAALVEGDANLVEAAYRDAQQGQEPRRTMSGFTRVHAPWYPLACRSDVEAASCGISNALNEDGAAFASALYRAGGITLLDAAHFDPPRSSLEILYPDLYLGGVTEIALTTELGAALDAASMAKSAVGQLGAYRVGQTLGSEVPVEPMRRFLHSLRGDAVAAVDKGLVLLTEWADDAMPVLVTVALRGNPNAPVAAVGKRRLVIGAMVKKEVVEAVAKHVSPKTAGAPPTPRAFAKQQAPPPAPPPTWKKSSPARSPRRAGKRFVRSGSTSEARWERARLRDRVRSGSSARTTRCSFCPRPPPR